MKQYFSNPRQSNDVPLSVRIGADFEFRFCSGQLFVRLMVLALLLIAAMMVGLVTPQTALAQQQISASGWKRGFHGFNIICKNAGLIHESRVKWMTVPDSQKILVVLGDVGNVPFDIDNFIDHGGAVLIATDGRNSKVVRRHGIEFMTTNIHTSFQRDSFQGFPDCPIVTDTRVHPSLENVDSIVANRPGLLTPTPTKRGPGGPKVIAYLPMLMGSSPSNRFIATVETQNGGRLMCVADQSVFANQMLIHGDNAIFALQAMNWLKSDTRTHLLVIADGSVESALDPNGVEIMLPPPTRREVLNALNNLPLSAMVEFGNAVATVVEDENMVNEFIHSSVDQVRPIVLRRALILGSFALICSVSLFTYIWQKKLMRQTASEVAFKRSKKANKNRKNAAIDQSEQWARQRQAAAGVLLHSFCWEIARRDYDDWPTFPEGLVTEADPPALVILSSLRNASQKYKSKKASFWTTDRVEKLEQDVAGWKSFFRSYSVVSKASD